MVLLHNDGRRVNAVHKQSPDVLLLLLDPALIRFIFKYSTTDTLEGHVGGTLSLFQDGEDTMFLLLGAKRMIAFDENRKSSSKWRIHCE
jgi:hypothetical protein